MNLCQTINGKIEELKNNKIYLEDLVNKIKFAQSKQ